MKTQFFRVIWVFKRLKYTNVDFGPTTRILSITILTNKKILKGLDLHF